jgi:2'-5' RNA ligase
MRLFIAVNFDDRVKEELFTLQQKIREHAIKGNFSREENFHLTLAFLGETEQALVSDIEDVITQIRIPPFEMVFSRLGCFTHARKELWWIGIDEKDAGDTRVKWLRQELADRLLERNIPFDNRSFNAHITLGREIRLHSPVDRQIEAVSIPVRRISLMKSERLNGKLVYTELSGCDLNE